MSTNMNIICFFVMDTFPCFIFFRCFNCTIVVKGEKFSFEFMVCIPALDFVGYRHDVTTIFPISLKFAVFLNNWFHFESAPMTNDQNKFLEIHFKPSDNYYCSLIRRNCELQMVWMAKHFLPHNSIIPQIEIDVRPVFGVIEWVFLDASAHWKWKTLLLHLPHDVRLTVSSFWYINYVGRFVGWPLVHTPYSKHYMHVVCVHFFLFSVSLLIL